MPWPPKRWRRLLRRWLRMTSLVLVIGGNALLLPGDSSSGERGVQRAAISQAANVEWSKLGWSPAWPGKVKRAGSPDPRAWTLNYQGVWALRSVGEQPERIFEALALFKKAVDLDAKFKEANYNLALTLDLCSLRYQALEAWDRFLKLKPEWSRAREAKQRKDALLAPTDEEVWLAEEKGLRQEIAEGLRPSFDVVVSASRESARSAVEERLLPEWAGLYLARRRSAAFRRLELAVGVAGSLAKATGDWLLFEAVDQVRDPRSSEEARRSIATGIALYGQGVNSYQASNYAEAEGLFERSWRILSRQGSPMAGWAAMSFAKCLYQRSDYAWAKTILEDVAAVSRGKGYRGLAAEGDLVFGMIEYIQGRPEEASRRFSNSLDLYSALDEPVHVVKALIRLGLALQQDDPREAWRHRIAALVGLRRTGQMNILRSSLIEAGARVVQPEAAIALANEWLEVATQKGNLDDRLAARRRRALIRAKFGLLEEARGELGELEQEVARISDPVQRETSEVELLEARAEVLSDAPKELLSVLDQLIDRTEDDRYPILLEAAYLERGKDRDRLGDQEGAAADFQFLASDREAKAAKVTNSQDRLTLFDLEPEAVGRLTALWVQKGRFLDALALMETVRGRFVTDQRGLLGKIETPPGRAGAELAAMARRLPVATAALVYRVDPSGEDLGVWIVRHSGIRYQPLLAKQREVQEALRICEDALSVEKETSVAGVALTALHEALLAPVKDLIQGSMLVIVPDGWLSDVPWSALREAGSGQSLIERHPILIAASLHVLLARSGEPFEPITPETPILQVSSSLTETGGRLGLRPLPEVDAETADLEVLYRREVTLDHERATKKAVLLALPGAEVFQFSGHARHGKKPFEPALLLGGDSGDSAESWLTTADVLSQTLTKTRLAVLVACGSGHDDMKRSSAQLSVALALVARGVRQVVATTWPVEDDLARLFSLELHRQLVGGLKPIEALRQTKLTFLRSKDPRQASPRAWAAFEVFGGL